MKSMYSLLKSNMIATITSGIEAHIDGVEKTAADGLKNQLLKTVQEKIKKPQNQQKPAPQ